LIRLRQKWVYLRIISVILDDLSIWALIRFTMSLHHAWSSSRLAFFILLRIYLLLLLQLLLLRKYYLFNISELPFYHRLFIWLNLSWFSSSTWLSSSFNLIRRPYSFHSFFAFFIILLYSWDLLCGKLCIRHWTTAHHIKVLCM
jgi:hypothetical protein